MLPGQGEGGVNVTAAPVVTGQGEAQATAVEVDLGELAPLHGEVADAVVDVACRVEPVEITVDPLVGDDHGVGHVLAVHLQSRHGLVDQA